MKTRPTLIYYSKQRGIALLVAMVLLLIMSLLGVASMRGTILEERMAGNWRDQNIALQAAEAALREGESFFETSFSPPALSDFPCSGSCTIFSYNEADPIANFLLRNNGSEITQWRTSATSYSGTITGSAEAPQYLIEQRAYVRDHLGTGFGVASETGRHMYQVTARGVGQTPQGVRIFQSLHAKRFN